MTRPLRITLTVNGRPVTASAAGPPERARLDQVLPALRALDDAVIKHAVGDHETPERRVTCTKGCSACCEAQPVPITPPEASALARLVDCLPQPRQRQVRAAFAAAVERLRDAGPVRRVYAQPAGHDRRGRTRPDAALFRPQDRLPVPARSRLQHLCRAAVRVPPISGHDTAGAVRRSAQPAGGAGADAGALRLGHAGDHRGDARHAAIHRAAGPRLGLCEEKKDELARTFPAKTVVETPLRHLPKM